MNRFPGGIPDRKFWGTADLIAKASMSLGSGKAVARIRAAFRDFLIARSGGDWTEDAFHGHHRVRIQDGRSRRKWSRRWRHRADPGSAIVAQPLGSIGYPIRKAAAARQKARMRVRAFICS